jgi:hypothetical protein
MEGSFRAQCGHMKASGNNAHKKASGNNSASRANPADG